MGYWYWRTLKNAWALDENTSNRFMLPNRGHLSGLHIVLDSAMYTQNYAVDNSWPSQCMDIRILGNGNKEIIDLRDRQIQAINFWETGEMPNDTLIDTTNADTRQHLFIPFGRYFGDPKYGLILEKFTAGVQFEDTNVLSTAVVRDGYTNYTIYGLFRKDPEPSIFNGGYFSKRQILNEDTLTRTQHSVTLPTKNLLKQIHLFVESDLSTYAMTTPMRRLLTNIWLGIKSQEEYIVDGVNFRDFYHRMHMLSGRKPHTLMTHDSLIANDCYIDTMIYDRETTSCAPYDDFVLGSRTQVEYKWDREERVARHRQYNAAGSRVAGYLVMHSIGTGYQGNCPLLYIDPKAEESEYLDSDDLADVTVEFTEYASTENVYIVLDELQKTYPT